MDFILTALLEIQHQITLIIRLHSANGYSELVRGYGVEDNPEINV
jgi:hypothetical protein